MKKLIAVVVTLVLVGAALFGVEGFLRKIVPQKFADGIRETLSLTADHEVDVRLNGILTLQYLTGAFKNVTVTVPQAPLGELMGEGVRADLHAHAAQMPVDPQKNGIVDAKIDAVFTQEQLAAVAQNLSRGIGEDVEIVGENIKIVTSISILGQKIPIKVAFTPSVNTAQLHITPVAIEAGPLALTVEQLPDFEALKKFADGVDVCVADRMPAGMSLEDITLSTANKLTVTMTLNPRIAMDESLQQPGKC